MPHACQLLLVPLTKTSSYLSWSNDPYIAWFSEVLQWLTFQKPYFGFFNLPIFQIGLWLAALVWAVGIVCCAVWVGRSFFNESFTVFWPIKVRHTVAGGMPSPLVCVGTCFNS
jgi:hypothetical protein